MRAINFESVQWARAATEKKLQFFYEMMGKNKKQFDETLQESRSKNSNKLRYRKRVQEEQEAEQQLREFEYNPDRESDEQ